MYIFQKIQSVLKNRKGGILFYVLAFFIFFLSWFHTSLGMHFRNIKMDYHLSLIKTRLNIEERIIKGFRSDTELELMQFYEGECTVVANRIDKIIYVNISGNIRMDFKYDIIIDGSFIYSQWEE